ncbi:unnamed protein product [Rotaria socialis]|uniref:Uncharacterized protein n=1 Tax=Rotaria socialis TaxID=392032 RepID=A0A821QYS3_9BILA|nr:unnamed protein product [Rotaria socialis]
MIRLIIPRYFIKKSFSPETTASYGSSDLELESNCSDSSLLVNVNEGDCGSSSQTSVTSPSHKCLSTESHPEKENFGGSAKKLIEIYFNKHYNGENKNAMEEWIGLTSELLKVIKERQIPWTVLFENRSIAQLNFAAQNDESDLKGFCKELK